MKYLTRILLVLAVFLLIVGGAFSVTGLVMGGKIGESPVLKNLREQLEDNKGFVVTSERMRNSIDKELDQTKPEESRVLKDGKNFEADVPDNLEITLSADELYLKAYDQEKIRIVFDDNRENEIEVATSENTLWLKSERKIHDGSITVYYPKDMNLKLMKVSLDAGRIVLEDDFRCDEMDITIGAGEFEASQSLEAAKAILEVGAGKVSIGQLTSVLLCGKCGVGSMELTMKGSEEDYNYYLECGLGSILIGENSHSSIADHEEISGNHSGKRIELSCGLGEIHVDFTE